MSEVRVQQWLLQPHPGSLLPMRRHRGPEHSGAASLEAKEVAASSLTLKA